MSRKLNYCRKCFTIYLEGGVYGKACACPKELHFQGELITYAQLEEMYQQMRRAHADYMREMINQRNLRNYWDGGVEQGRADNYYMQDLPSRQRRNVDRDGRNP